MYIFHRYQLIALSWSPLCKDYFTHRLILVVLVIGESPWDDVHIVTWSNYQGIMKTRGHMMGLECYQRVQKKEQPPLINHWHQVPNLLRNLRRESIVPSNRDHSRPCWGSLSLLPPLACSTVPPLWIFRFRKLIFLRRANFGLGMGAMGRSPDLCNAKARRWIGLHGRTQGQLGRANGTGSIPGRCDSWSWSYVTI